MTVGPYGTTAKLLDVCSLSMCCLGITVKDTEQGCNTVVSKIILNKHTLVFRNGKQIRRQKT